MLRMVAAHNPSPMTLDGTRSYVVGGDVRVVIDPGPPIPEHLRGLREALEGAETAAIVVTHAHPDHAAAAPEIARHTGAPIWMAPGALHAPFPTDLVGHWIQPDDALQTDAGTLRFVPTPGHAPEHVAVQWAAGGPGTGVAIFVGDLLMGEGDTALVAWPEGDVTEYLASLARIENMAPDLLYPTHGPPITDPAGAIDRYRSHRLERLEQVRRALRRAPASLSELRKRVYGDTIPPGLESAAEASLLALLVHLEDVGEATTAADGLFQRTGP
jgi:glyoxylase-like metal-dependent hydrolase (beta-lactamase superfamily II)